MKEFNNKHSHFHKEVRKNGAVQPIQIFVTDTNKQWTGGISAQVYWDWVELNEYWLSEDLRVKGLGTKLLDQLEAIAKQKGAKKALLTTFEFQARSFYEKRGYQVVGEIKDYPPGSSYYTMVKVLR
ncbi:MAG: GNAT family N-acetyltransferase [Bacillus sp. (in: Bacteria)]|nr:GNAT family N-acetyltransferase [Bacillus sp. (in: firmicutes)]